jgi:hypothetical protein
MPLTPEEQERLAELDATPEPRKSYTREEAKRKLLEIYNRSGDELLRLCGVDSPAIARSRRADQIIAEAAARGEQVSREEANARAAADPLGTTPLPLLYYSDITANLDAADFVEDLLIDGGMSVIYGPSGCGKTFFTLDLALHVAAGLPWRGRAVDQRGVLYLALEGSHGFKNRVTAFKSANHAGLADLPFAGVPVAVDLLNPAADTARVIEAARTAAAKLSIPVGLIIVDTLSRALAGGNENSPEDMGALVRNLDRIRQELPAHIMPVHHSGKDVAQGARGHSLLRAATDTEIEVTRDISTSISTARVTKQRELECAGEFSFRLVPVELGTNRRGKPVTSCVVKVADPPARESKLGDDAQAALNALYDLISEGGRTGLPGVPDGLASVMEAAWRERFYERCKPGEKPETKKKAFGRSKDKLIAARRVAANGERVWISSPTTATS